MATDHYQIGNVNTADLTADDVYKLNQLIFDGFCRNGEVADHVGMLSRLRAFQREVGEDVANDAFQWLCNTDCTEYTEERELWMSWDAYEEVRHDIFYVCEHYGADELLSDFIDGNCWWYTDNRRDREAADAMFRFLGYDDFGAALEAAMSH